MTKLVELNAEFLGNGGEGVSDENGQPVPHRPAIGVVMDCPCGKCMSRLFVAFANPLDGGGPVKGIGNTWDRTGDTIETLTLRPSIKRVGGCGWHGFITNGETSTA